MKREAYLVRRPLSDEIRFTSDERRDRSLYVSRLPFYVPQVAKYEDLRGDENSLLAISGRAWVFGDRITCRQLLAPEHLDKPPIVSSAFVMAGIDAQFARTVVAGDFIVAGLEFAADVTHANVPAALKALGIGGVVARSFGPFFLRTSIATGLPALVVEETAAIRGGDRLRVDVEAHVVANLSSGDRYVVRNIDEATLIHLRRSQMSDR